MFLDCVVVSGLNRGSDGKATDLLVKLNPKPQVCT